MKYLVAIISIALLFQADAYAQQVSVLASVSETTIGSEEAVSYRIEVEGASTSEVQRPSPPEADGLAVLQSVPSTQQSVSIVNGQMTQSVAYEWRYRASREGNASIKPAEITVKGKVYQTQPITISVVPQSQRPQRQTRPSSGSLFDPFGRRQAAGARESEPASRKITKRDIFIRAVPSARNVVQNEQVNIEYHLFFREGMQLRQSRLADSWDAEGFWREELDVERRPVPRTIVENGLRYNTIVLKRVAVFPTRTGDLSIDPLRIEAEAFIPNRSLDPFDQFFSFRPRYEPVEVASETVSINVSSLPGDRPESFTGAVGLFVMEAKVDREEVEVGEPIQVEVTLSGTGNIATMEPPPFNPPGVFEQYDPQVRTSIDRSGGKIRGTKTLTYVLVPRSNGTFQIPQLEMSFYNPDRDQFESISPRPTTIRVTGTASAPVATRTSSTGLPVDDIAGLLPVVSTWKEVNRSPLHRQTWVYLALGVPLLVLGGFLAQHKYQSKLAGDIGFARNRRAHPVARKHLKKAEELLAANQPRAFYEEIERAVLSFIGNRLNVADTGKTRQELDRMLAVRQVDAEHRQELLALLEECDRTRFAPIPPDQTAMDTACDRASGLIVYLDRIFK